jgi:hypothetical protein
MPLSGSHSHTATVTVDQTTPAASLDDFTMYIDLADMPAAFWDSVANGGGDIRTFLADGTELAREVVSCDATYQAFDGVDDYALVTGITPSVSTGITVTMRYRSSTLSAGDWLFALSGSDSSPLLGVKFGDGADGDHIGVYARRNNAAENISAASGLVTSAVAGGDDVWHTVTFIASTSGVSLVLDGVTIGTWAALSPDYTITQFAIGGVYRSSLAVPSAIDVEYVEISQSLSARYDAVNISGTTWTDSIGSNDATLHGSVAATELVGTGELHVKVPTLSVIQDTVLHLYTDGASSDYAVTDTFGRNAVWGDYERVYHLGTLSDSTGNANLTAIGTATVGGTVGPLGDAATLDGNSDYFTATPYDFGTGDFTAQAWAKTSDTARNDILVQGNTNGDWHGVYTNSSGYLAGAIDDGANAVFEESSIGTRIDDDAWHKVDIASDRSASMELYVDGDPDKSSASISAVGDVYTTGDLMIGARIGAGGLVTANLWDGAIAEVRLRTGALSANWITTEYNNQSDPSLFYTATDPNAGGGATVDTASLLAQAAAVTGTFTIEGAAGTVTVTFADLQAQSATTPASTATREITSSAALSATDIEFLNYAAREVTSASTLAAQSAAVSGSSDPMRTSEGVLTAQEADLAGTASRTVVAVGSVQAQDSGVASTVGQNQNVTGTGVLTTFPVSLMAAVAINGEVPVTGSLATTQIATSRQH